MATYGKATGPAILLPTGGLAGNTETAKYPLGQLFQDDRGNYFRYIKANEALTKGQAVTSVALGAWDSGIAVDGAVTSGDTYIHIDTVTTSMTANQYAGYYVRQAAASGKGAMYRISGHNAIASSGEGDIYLEDAVEEAMANNAALEIYNPYLVEKIDATTEQIQGIAIEDITSGYHGFVQVGGVCQYVLVGHSTSAAIVLDEPLTPVGSGLAGSLMGMAGGDEADIMEAANSPLRALDAVAANTVGLIPAKFIMVV